MTRFTLLLLSCLALSGCVGANTNPLAVFGPNRIPAPGWQERDSKEYYAALNATSATLAATPAASNSPAATTAPSGIPTTTSLAAQPSTAAASPSPKPTAAIEPPIRIVESAAPRREPVEISRLPAPPPAPNPPAGTSPAPGLLPRGASIPFKGQRTLSDSNVAPATFTTPDPTAGQWRAR